MKIASFGRFLGVLILTNFMFSCTYSEIKQLSASSTEVSFANDIAPMFITAIPGNTKACIGCRTSTTSTKPKFTVDDATADYDLIVSKVTPGDAANSLIYMKVSGTHTSGKQMPWNGPNYFNSEELQLFYDWINQGAQNN